MESESAILSRLDTEPPLPVQPLFNRLLSFQQRNVRARQLAMRVKLPRLRGREMQGGSGSVSEERETVRRHRVSPSFLDISLSIKYRQQRMTHRFHLLAHAESRKNSLPSVPPPPKKSRPKEPTLFPILIPSRSPDVSPERVRMGVVHPLSLSTDNAQTTTRKAVSNKSVIKSLHTLDLQVPISMPEKKRFRPVQHRAFRIRFLSNRTKVRVSSISEANPDSPSESPSPSPYSLSRYFQDNPFLSQKPLKQRKILLQNINHPRVITAASNESDSDPVLFPVFS